jgi:hypothetical protein
MKRVQQSGNAHAAVPLPAGYVSEGTKRRREIEAAKEAGL